MTTIKEVAERTMQSCGPHEKLQDAYLRFATRFLAEWSKTQEPRGWWNPSYPALSVQLTKPYDGGGWEPFFTAPPLPEPAPKETALSKYKRLEVEYETTDPVERLRAFCSFAMDGQDWLDVEPFLDAITEPAPECEHHYVRDCEAVQHFCCQKCGDVKRDTTEPAPQDSLKESSSPEHTSSTASDSRPAVGAAPSSEEVREMVERLRDVPNAGDCDVLMNSAADLIERLAAERDELLGPNPVEQMLREQLAASQAREQQLRKALEFIVLNEGMVGYSRPYDEARAALSLPQDDTALRQWGAKLLRAMVGEMIMGEDQAILRRKADELEDGK